MSPRVVAIVAVALVSAGALAGLMLWTREQTLESSVPQAQSAMVVAAPTPISRVLVNVLVPRAAIEEALNAAVPRTEAGARPNPLPDPVIDDSLSWDFARQNITVASGGGSLEASVAIAGTVRVAGTIQVICGDLGKLLGKLNPTRIPISQHADLGASATVAAAPALKEDWRLAAGLSVRSLNVNEAAIRVLNIAEVSMRGETERILRPKLDGLVHDANARIAADPFIEEAARKVWGDLCRSFPVDAGAAGRLWIDVAPVAALATPAVIDEAGLRLGVGIDARIGLSDVETRPECPFPPTLTAPPTGDLGRFALAAPVRVGYDTLNRALAAPGGVVGRTFRDEPTAIEAVIASAEVRPDGNRLLLTVAFDARETRWFGARVSGKAYLGATPHFDAASKEIRFKNVSLAAESEGALNVLGALGRTVGGLLARRIEETARIDVAREEENAKARANAALAALAAAKPAGATVKVEAETIALAGIEVAADGLGLALEARGPIAVTLDKVDLKR